MIAKYLLGFVQGFHHVVKILVAALGILISQLSDEGPIARLVDSNDEYFCHGASVCQLLLGLDAALVAVIVCFGDQHVV